MSEKVIIYTSYHHHNTLNLLKQVLNPDNYTWINLLQEQEIDLTNYQTVILASGIYFGKMEKRMLSFISMHQKELQTKKLAVIITSGRAPKNYQKSTKRYFEKLGLTSVPIFACLGFDTFGPLRLLGGLNKGRPNRDDAHQLQAFVEENQLDI